MPVRIRTFADIGLAPGPVTEALAQTNLIRLNAALQDGDDELDILLGLSGIYYIASSGSLTSIVLASNSVVRCLPGCTIKWKIGSGITPTLLVPSSVSNGSWTGGTFSGEPDSNGVYPVNHVLDIRGDDILLDDITVDGFSGIAFRVLGNRVRFPPDLVVRTSRLAGLTESEPAGIR